MKQKNLILFAGLVWGAALHAQPTVTAILNNASYIRPGLPGTGIAQGSIFAVFGTGMGPAALTQSGFPLQTELAGTSIRISIGGTEVSAFMVFTSAGQLAAILPSNTPVGNGLARVTFNGQPSAQFPITVVRNALGLFTLNGAGTGPAVITDANFNVITYTNAARPGQTVIAWGTGLIGVTFPDNQPANVFDFQQQAALQMFVGGRSATVRYAGRSNCCAGLDQIVFDIPDGVQGCNVSLTGRAQTSPSNFATIAVAPSGGACSDPNGFTEQDFNLLSANGRLRIGNISLTRATSKITVPGFGTAESKSDTAGASFISFDANSLIRSAGIGGASYGSCTVTTFAVNNPGGNPVPFTPLDAGPSLGLSATAGQFNLARNSTGFYSASLATSLVIPGLPGGIPGQGNTPPVLEPGTFTVRGPGGADVGAFEARVTIPANFLWTNQDAITRVIRANSLEITWSGGSPANDYVSITGTSTGQNNVGATFICTERASAGRFSVPSEVLSALPASIIQQGSPQGILSVANLPTGNLARFTAPGVDIGTFTYSTGHTKNVPIE